MHVSDPDIPMGSADDVSVIVYALISDYPEKKITFKSNMSHLTFSRNSFIKLTLTKIFTNLTYL